MRQSRRPSVAGHGRRRLRSTSRSAPSSRAGTPHRRCPGCTAGIARSARCRPPRSLTSRPPSGCSTVVGSERADEHGAVDDVELPVDVRQVSLDGAPGDERSGTDLRVRRSFGDERAPIGRYGRLATTGRVSISPRPGADHPVSVLAMVSNASTARPAKRHEPKVQDSAGREFPWGRRTGTAWTSSGAALWRVDACTGPSARPSPARQSADWMAPFPGPHLPGTSMTLCGLDFDCVSGS